MNLHRSRPAATVTACSGLSECMTRLDRHDGPASFAGVAQPDPPIFGDSTWRVYTVNAIAADRGPSSPICPLLAVSNSGQHHHVSLLAPRVKAQVSGDQMNPRASDRRSLLSRPSRGVIPCWVCVGKVLRLGGTGRSTWPRRRHQLAGPPSGDTSFWPECRGFRAFQAPGPHVARPPPSSARTSTTDTVGSSSA
jgi:hypothetical protein